MNIKKPNYTISTLITFKKNENGRMKPDYLISYENKERKKENKIDEKGNIIE